MSKIKVGFIGVGLMGLPMVQNIAKNNIKTICYNFRHYIINVF